MFFAVVFLCLASTTVAKFEPECWMSPAEIAEKNGYKLTRHWVTTKDGYILELHNILPTEQGARNTSARVEPGARNTSARAEVVFLQHGLLDSSITWILNGKNGSLGYILADAGYNVWMGNVRGNTYSRNHTTLSPMSTQFWDFTFEEMAAFDLPAMLEYVTRETGEQSIFYVGHSQGTEIGFIEFSRNQDLAKKVKLFTALAPVARVTNINGLIWYAAKMEKLLNWAVNVMGVQEFFPSWWLPKILVEIICPHVETIFCTNIMFAITGSDMSNFNSSRVEVYECHNPAGTSIKNARHWLQLINSKELKMFDYKDPKENMKRYGQNSPPVYDITPLDVPTVLFMGGEDWLADPQDEIWLIEKIGHAVKKSIVIDYYDHVDFIWGMDAKKMIYQPMIEYMKSLAR